MNRRAFLYRGALAGGTLGVARALHNTVIGYGQFGLGDSLLTTDLDPTVRKAMPSLTWKELPIDGRTVRVTSSGVRYDRDGELEPVTDDAPAWVRGLERDVEDLHSDAFTFRFEGIRSFFETLASHDVRPPTVAVLRGQRKADPTLVEAATGVPPTDPRAVLDALVDLFRERSRYDVPRYIAGSIDDNVLPVDADLRGPLEPDVDFERLAHDDGTIGMFCTEYTRLATEALHAAPATEQTPPVFSVTVRNRRHKHVYNGIGSVVRADGELVLPMTFADYTETTLIDDFRAGRFLDDSLDAYDGRHRMDQVRW